MKHHNDILNGVGNVTGISLDDFVSSHMSKLTLYDSAVNKFGAEQALFKLKTLSFRNFQDELKIKTAPCKSPKANKQLELIDSSTVNKEKEQLDVDKEQKALILEYGLSASEKRLLHIIAKGGIPCLILKLDEEQVKLVEERVRQRRKEILEEGIINPPVGFKRKSYNPKEPLAISDDLYHLTNISDIVNRIKEGLALIVPTRRAIAILTYRLFSEDIWKQSGIRIGRSYTNFADFAKAELGMGEDYRDYLAVGKVLKNYYYFLDGFSDMDTEDNFFKLRYLPQALKTHKGNEPLVLARLRSLTIREFKQFSELPSFEITFSKKLKDKQLETFRYYLIGGRGKVRQHPLLSCDYIEAFHKDEFGMIQAIERKVIEESKAKASTSLIQKDVLHLKDNARQSVDTSVV